MSYFFSTSISNVFRRTIRNCYWVVGLDLSTNISVTARDCHFRSSERCPFCGLASHAPIEWLCGPASPSMSRPHNVSAFIDSLNTLYSRQVDPSEKRWRLGRARNAQQRRDGLFTRKLSCPRPPLRVRILSTLPYPDTMDHQENPILWTVMSKGLLPVADAEVMVFVGEKVLILR